jgi:hypothetical protein
LNRYLSGFSIAYPSLGAWSLADWSFGQKQQRSCEPRFAPSFGRSCRSWLEQIPAIERNGYSIDSEFAESDELGMEKSASILGNGFAFADNPLVHRSFATTTIEPV